MSTKAEIDAKVAKAAADNDASAKKAAAGTAKKQAEKTEHNWTVEEILKREG